MTTLNYLSYLNKRVYKHRCLVELERVAKLWGQKHLSTRQAWVTFREYVNYCFGRNVSSSELKKLIKEWRLG